MNIKRLFNAKFWIKFFIKITIFCLIIFVVFLILDKIFPLQTANFNRPQSKFLFDKDQKLIAMKLSSDQIWREKISIEKIPIILQKSTIFFEDRYFYSHFGVNFASIFKAFFYNLTHKNRIGASTITMQVARMIEPKKRSYKNKIIEIFRSFQLEFHLNKDEILEIYFNLAPYGGNIEGIKMASYFYFNKNIQELSIAQMALLSTLPKNPNKNRLDKKSNINQLKNSLIKKLYQNKIISKSEFNRALKEKTSPFRQNSINLVTNFANLAFDKEISQTKINLNYQKKLQEILTGIIKKYKDKNLQNSAAILIDNSDLEVVAYVSSHDKFAKNGQNDGVLSQRSVGSILKPFIFGLGLDYGFITPKTEVIDTQIFLNDYLPKNYNKHFSGLIGADEALNYSLNIPFISLNTKLGENSLYEILDNFNLVLKNKDFYGQSIVLGSSGANLFSMVTLFSAFANNGIVKKQKFLPNFNFEKRILSPQSAYLTTKVLQNTPRVYLNSIWQNTQNMPPLAFKTGTSSKNKDLLSIGFTPKYTLGVWFGNFSGEKTQNLNASQTASLAVLQMFSYISKNEILQDFIEPKGLIKKEICLDSYESKKCKNLKEDYLIKGVNLQNKCQNLRIDEINFLQILGLNFCEDEKLNLKPLIVSPPNNAVYEKLKNNKILIKCLTSNSLEVFIKIDDANYTKFEKNIEFFREFKSGLHKISCLDENGNFSQNSFYIKDK